MSLVEPTIRRLSAGLKASLIGAALFAALPPASADPPPGSDPAPAAKPIERKFYFETPDDRAMLDAALARAKAQGKLAVIVFGADWCHDSRALARVLTSDAFRAEFASRFAVTFIDVGEPQTGHGRNLDLVGRFGVNKLKSTPALFVISPNGKRLNSKRDAVGWRNADSRGEGEVLGWFRDLGKD